MAEKIIWTITDEAPALATYSLLPIVQAFTAGTGIDVEARDISLAARILAAFPENLTESQRVSDDLSVLGQLSLTRGANIIKLPNISASIPQLKEAIRELRSQGYAVPEYPETPADDRERLIHARYARVLGSAVNPVLREGNSDRRAPLAVKSFAKKNPHQLAPWPPASRAEVAHMTGGDFYGNEQSVVMETGGAFRIELDGDDGSTRLLRDGLTATPGEILDATFMSVKALRRFYAEQFNEAARNGQLLSLHLKSTMMKVSDPILFGHAVSIFFSDVFIRHSAALAEAGVDARLGLADLYRKIESLPGATRAEIAADIQSAYRRRPALAMVDSARGITNLHAPNDVIIDASMPVVIRDGGRMWNAEGKLQDTRALIPDRCYAGIYAEVIADCRKHGAFDPATMGSVPNVGLMAQKAEEYGSHPTTFEIPVAGRVRVLDAGGAVLMEHDVEAGDVWRLCRTGSAAVRDWVSLAVRRARATGTPAIFWLDSNRAHDTNLIAAVVSELRHHDLDGLDVRIMGPVQAMRHSLRRIRKGLDTISVTGNVLRDYLTDLFPILELGTSAKMLSIVPLLAGGGLFETGAGGSAPRHVQQFVKEGYLRWDSLGEFSALAASLEHLGAAFGNAKAQILAATLDQAIARFLDNNRSPARKVGEIDNRGSHFYLALYWAQALADQYQDLELRTRFNNLAARLMEFEDAISEELLAAQGRPADLGGYYHPDPASVARAMRPSETLNRLIAGRAGVLVGAPGR